MTARTFENIKAIDGWLNDGEILYFMEQGKKPGLKVEIGSWKGKSTIALASAGNPVVAIDIFTGSSEHINNPEKFGHNIWTFPEFWENVKKFGLEKVIIPIVADNQRVDFIKDIDFLFIDGAHDYNSAMADYVKWFPRVKDTGTITVHDMGRQIPCGSEVALKDYLKSPRNTGWQITSQVVSLAVITKKTTA